MRLISLFVHVKMEKKKHVPFVPISRNIYNMCIWSDHVFVPTQRFKKFLITFFYEEKKIRKDCGDKDGRLEGRIIVMIIVMRMMKKKNCDDDNDQDGSNDN